MTDQPIVLRDYGPGGVSVVLATNEQGRIEPFVFERREDAERTVRVLREAEGSISTVLCWHGVELLDAHGAQRFNFGLRGFADPQATRFRMKERPETECTFAGYNYHGLGEFIAQFDDGSASSEFCRDWEPVNGRWPDER
jgi:hypothetical protein